ncbi:MAG: ATP-binding protein [Anaerolineae bacterium]
MSSNVSSNAEKEIPQPCPECGGTGYLRLDVPVGHPDFGKFALCQCKEREREAQRLKRLRKISNLDALARFTFETFQPQGFGLSEARQRNLRSAYEAALAFVDDPAHWLILLGGFGCGKTHLAAAIANRVVERGSPAVFVVVPDLLDHLRTTYSPHSDTGYDQRFEEIRTASLLILDDLGTENATPWAREKLFQIFNYRYNAQLPTVITSNHELEEIDIRIRSRLIDPDLTRIVAITAPDFRQSGVAQGISHLSDLSTLTLHSAQTFKAFDLRKLELDRNQAENLHRAYETARSFANRTDGWLLFTGSSGCGKTHLAAAIANKVVSEGGSALFVVVPDLLDHLRATFNPNSLTSLDKRFDQVKRSELLILDDLGTESATPWAREKLYQLINYRYNARLPTVFTTGDISNIDERLKSRLFDLGLCTNFQIDVPSYRGSPGRGRSGQRQR